MASTGSTDVRVIRVPPSVSPDLCRASGWRCAGEPPDCDRPPGRLSAWPPLAACNPQAFNDLSDKTWVDTSARPDGLDSDDYAIAIGFGGSGRRTACASSSPRGPRPASPGMIYDSNGTLSRPTSAPGQATSPGGQPARPCCPAVASYPTNFDSNGRLGRDWCHRQATARSPHALMVNRGRQAGPDVQPAAAWTSASIRSTWPSDRLARRRRARSRRPTSMAATGTAALDLSRIRSYQGEPAPRSSTCTLAEASLTALLVADAPGASGDPLILATGRRAPEVTSSPSRVPRRRRSRRCGVRRPRPCRGPARPRPPPPPSSAMSAATSTATATSTSCFGLPDEDRVILLLNPSASAPDRDRASTRPMTPTTFGTDLAVGDFDDDGKDDLAVGDPGGHSEGTKLAAARSTCSPARATGPGARVSAILFDASPDGGPGIRQGRQQRGRSTTRRRRPRGRRRGGGLSPTSSNPLGGDDVRHYPVA